MSINAAAAEFPPLIKPANTMSPASAISVNVSLVFICNCISFGLLSIGQLLMRCLSPTKAQRISENYHQPSGISHGVPRPPKRSQTRRALLELPQPPSANPFCFDHQEVVIP